MKKEMYIMYILKRIGAILLAVSLCSLTFAGCEPKSDDDEQDDPAWREERLAGLLAAPPNIRESKAPFAVGELIPPTLDYLFWQIRYGDFPVMMCSETFADFGNGFAETYLGPRDRGKDVLYLVGASEKDYAIGCFLGKVDYREKGWSPEYDIYDDPLYGPHSTIRFENAEINLLLTELNDDDKAMLKAASEEIVCVEIARKAVAFVVSEDTPVEGLSLVQLKDVLTGKVTDWSAFSGGTLPIGLYCDLYEGMEAVLNQYVLGGEELADNVYALEKVGTLTGTAEVPIRQTYDKQKGGCFVTDLHTAKTMDGIKILSIDGIVPAAETIRSGEYPLAVSCYAVYRTKDEDGPPGRFAQWSATPEGTAVIRSIGLVTIGVDFSEAIGEIGLAGVDGIALNNVESIAKGIWYDEVNGLWLYCPGGVLLSFFDGYGGLKNCGYFDTFWETVTLWDDVSYNVYENDEGGLDFVHKESYDFDNPDFVFTRVDTLDITPQTKPGIPLEGLAAAKEAAHNPYLGQWISSEITCQIDIKRNSVSFDEARGDYYYGATRGYTVDDSGVLVLMDVDESLTENISATGMMYINDDGSLTVEGYSGLFYPKDTSGVNPYQAYSGEWYNDEEEMTLYLGEDGGLSYTSPDTMAGFSMWSVEGGNKLNILSEEAYVNDDGDMVIEGYRGVFKRK